MALGTRNIPASTVFARDASSGRRFTCRPDDDVRDALETMATDEVGRLPVVDREEHLIGILSIDDVIFRAGGGRSCLTDREIMDAVRAIRESRIHQRDAAVQEEPDSHSAFRKPLNYPGTSRFH